MVKKILPFIFVTLVNSVTLFGGTGIAILEPIALTNNVEAMEKTIIRAEITKAITYYGYSAYTRTLDIDKILQEQNFQQTGIVDDATRKRIGAMQGVSFLCITKITKEENAFYLEANLLNVETAEIMSPSTAYFEMEYGNWETMISACKSLAEELIVNETLPEDIVSPDEIFVIVESMPEFPGGQQAMLKFIADTIKYPVIAQQNGIQGRVVCEFVIEKDGRTSDIQVVRSSNEPSLDKEAIRVISIMPSWKPGRQRGKPVRVKYTIPINFRLK